ncbi:MAG: zinc ribbon domain-containing protein [Anaerolineae bacterium]|nr:zinc ribbon domain-containing protein [Anaerolineae bacterium]
MMFGIDLGDTGGLLTIGAVYGGLVLVAFWLAMIVWTYRDMRARSRDALAQILVTLLVVVLTLPGLLIYIFLRPRETLSEAYERSLEEEALLQEIEEKPTCPGCKQRVEEDWQACPNCHTRLKRPCTRCGRMLELGWDVCPYCVTPVAARVEHAPVAYTREAQDNRAPRTDTGAYRTTPQPQTIEFVDGEEI